MNNILFVFLSLSLSSSILALILLALKPLVKGRLSQTWQYYIWLIVILRFLLPFTPQVSVVGEMSRYVQKISSPSAAVEVDSDIDVNEEYTTPQAPQTLQATAPQSIKAQTPVQPAFWRDILNNVWMFWITVALMLFVHKVTSYRSFVRFVKVGMNKITDTYIWDIYRAELAAAKVKRQILLYENNQVISPMLVGIVRPALVIPALDASDDELRNILRHELTHYKRFDFLYKWIVQITLCLHWFNPLVYLINKQINKSCELSCDEAVIKHLDEDDRITYGDALIASLKAQGNYGDFVVSMTMSENGNLVKERLDVIMSYKKKSVLVICTTILLTSLLLCGATFTGAYAAGNNLKETPEISSSENLDNNTATDTENIEIKTATVGSAIYYLIDTEQQLRSIGSGKYTLDLNYMLNCDITLTEEWIPIGGFDNPFTGTFTGNGFEIINLTITNPNAQLIGLFGHAENAKIYNVTLRNLDIESAGGKGKTVGAVCVG